MVCRQTVCLSNCLRWLVNKCALFGYCVGIKVRVIVQAYFSASDMILYTLNFQWYPFILVAKVNGGLEVVTCYWVSVLVFILFESFDEGQVGLPNHHQYSMKIHTRLVFVYGVLQLGITLSGDSISFSQNKRYRRAYAWNSSIAISLSNEGFLASVRCLNGKI